MKVEALYELNDVRRMFVSFDKPRDRAMFCLAINTGFRISDVLRIRKYQVMGDTLSIKEQKTGNVRTIGITKDLRDCLDKYLWRIKDDNDFIFPSAKANKEGEYVISPTQAYRIFKAKATELGIDVNFGTHSCRKTWGYHMYMKYKNVAFLMEVFGHTTEAMTLRYIGASKQQIIQETRKFDLGLGALI